MLRSLTHRIASLLASTPARKPAARRPRLAVESLEGRALMSAAPLLAVTNSAQPLVSEAATINAGVSAPLHNPIIVLHQVPNLQGLTFHLVSTNGSPAHDLAIKTEHFNALHLSATFTGTWHGEGGSGNTTAITGALTTDTHGSVKMTFSWGNHSFTGTVTWVPPSFSHFAYVPGHYHLDGNVTVPGGGGPGHVEGNAFAAPILHL